MLIVSKFHDYYDTALSTGVDKTIVYERKEWRLKIPDFFRTKDTYTKRFVFSYYGKESLNFNIIGFCGKLYPLLTYKEDLWCGDKITNFYNFHDFENFLIEKKVKISGGENYFVYENVEKRWNKLIEFCNKDHEKFFLDNKIVCFVTDNSDYRNPVLRINCCLKKYDFVKVKDPYTAFQDIMMYISGVLGTPNRPMIEIEDVVRLEAHGFDKKISFRKAPTKRKKL